MRHVELDDCAQSGRTGKFSFTLLDGDGATVLGTSSGARGPGAERNLGVLDQTFPYTGAFALDVSAVPGVLQGDLSLRFY